MNAGAGAMAAGPGAAAPSGEAAHAARRDALRAQLPQFLDAAASRAPAPLGLRKDTSNLFRDPPRAGRRRLDLREFDHVIAVDPERGQVVAEGMTTYEDLVAATLARGVLPQVVPQLKTITLGGAAAGVGIEASSFRHGLVHDSLLEFDVLTAMGDIVTCRPDNAHRDLFFGFPNSYGTLGYAIRLVAKTMPAEPFVALAHRRFGTIRDCFAALEKACADGADFVDGVAFGPGELVLTTGRFVQSAPYVSDYTFEKIYYRSLAQRPADFLTAHDFVWRWDTDWFWCSKNVGAQIPWVRRLLGRHRLGSRTYQRVMRWNARWGITATLDRLRGGHAESVIQDVDIPLARAPEFLEFFQREVGIAPVWICPVAGPAAGRTFPLYPLEPGCLYVNFGFWDVVRRPVRHSPGHFNRLVESKVLVLGGIKSLYSDCFFERDLFERCYGGSEYRALKARYDPAGRFPELYDKVVLRR